jgi:hypothetical protein
MAYDNFERQVEKIEEDYPVLIKEIDQTELVGQE